MFVTLQDSIIHQLVEAQVSKHPARTAVHFNHETLTYQELNQRANQLAHHLKTLGVQPETFVGICAERSLNMLVAMLGVLKAGGTYIPLDPNYPAERLAYIVKNAELSIVITQSHLVTFESCQTIDIEADWTTISQQPVENLANTITPQNLAYVIYTSGSTGKPKGVQVTHQGVANFLLSMQQEPGLTSRDRLLAVTTISFDIAVLELFLPLTVGACVVIAPAETVADGHRLIRLLESSQSTVMQATPATWRLLLQSEWQGNAGLKMLCGGEAMTRSLANQLLKKGGSLWNLYGPTETTIWSAIHRVEPGTEPVSIGHPIANTQIYIIETQSQRKDDPITLVPTGIPGELCIGGDGVARGYFKRPDLNDEKFISDPFSEKIGNRLYRTGDLARYRPDGTIEFIGRIDHQAKIRGYRVELGEVEAAISQATIVQETAVITKEDASGNQRLIAYSVPKACEETASHLQYVEQWKTVWDTAYRQPADIEDVTFNINGWKDSYTGLPTASEVMQEWLDLTIERILALRPQRILEIGCGTGLLLFRLAQHCTHYHGVDVAPEAIGYVQQQFSTLPGDWSNVTVSQKAAHELDDLDSTFDTIVINSVAQYFPSAEYLTTVLEKAARLVRPGGRIFIGDVRSLPLLEAFHTSVQLSQAHDSITQLRAKIRERIAQERELVIDPVFFQTLAQRISQLGTVEIELKRGRADSELVRFRYDVTLHVEPEQKAISEFRCLDWMRDGLSLETLRSQLNNTPLRITRIPDARLQAELSAVQQLTDLNCPDTIEQFRATTQSKAGVHPEDLILIAHGYRVKLLYSEQSGFYDAWVYSEDCKVPIALLPTPQSYTNYPLQTLEKPQLTLQLRQFLREKLPSYMIPSVFIWLEKLPLTPNGKIDRRALPEPQVIQSEHSPSAPSTPAEHQMAAIWTEVLEVNAIGIHDNFFDLGGHSLLAAQLLAQVKAVFEVEIPLFYLFKEPTVKGLLSAIGQIQSLEIIPIQSSIDLQAETQLDLKIQPEMVLTQTEPTGIFLTGATGFLGAFLLNELLQQTSATVYCLVRAANLKDAINRVQANLERYLIWNEALRDRIVPIVGDLAQPYFGLSEAAFLKLATQAEVIYHSGALINLAYPYAALRDSNVGGTEEVLRLASLIKTKPVHFVSTLDVFQSPSYFNDRLILEQDSLAYGDELYRGYAQTKWVAEKLVKTAADRGIPVNIYRPGMISGHSETGISQTNDLLCRFLKGMIQLKSAPILDRPISMVPVDYVSKAIVHLSQQSNYVGQVFHLTNPNPLHLGQIVHILKQYGFMIAELPYERWLTKLTNNAQGNALAPLIALLSEQSVQQQTYLETSLLSTQNFDNQTTLRGLRGTSIVCPPSNAKQIKVYLEYFDRIGFLPLSNDARPSEWSLDREILSPASLKISVK